MSMVLEVLSAIFLVLGGFLAFAAALGIVRMPDVYIRMHASTKAGTLGVGLIVMSLVLVGGEASVVGKGIAIFAFIVLTAPIGAHLIGRSAWRCGIKPWQYRPSKEKS